MKQVNYNIAICIVSKIREPLRILRRDFLLATSINSINNAFKETLNDQVYFDLKRPIHDEIVRMPIVSLNLRLWREKLCHAE